MKVADPNISKQGGGVITGKVGWTGGEQRKLRKFDTFSVLIILILLSTLTTKTGYV